MMKACRRCKVCNEEIAVHADNWVQEMAAESYLKLKCHNHYLKIHNAQYLKRKGIIKAVLRIILAWFFWIVLAPIFYITYPFWWLHEKIGIGI